MTIEIPGYESVFPNAIYGRDKELRSEKGPVAGRELIILQKYVEPTEDGALELLIETVRAASVSLPGGFLVEGKSALELAVSKLPEKVKKDILTGHLECLRFIRNNTPARVLSTGENPDQYLAVNYGILPKGLIDRYAENIAREGPEWYREVFYHPKLKEVGLGEKCQITLPYDNNTDYGVIKIEGSAPRELLNLLSGELYPTLTTLEGSAGVTDVSRAVLERVAMNPILALLNNVTEVAEAQSERSSRGFTGRRGPGGLVH
ncbi:hypothetical protein HYU23_01190 [Candidatus Woesearchaeota archaeon]|nr:hypothetical protein [Candidatus Woesearchaeota archaeon]